MAAASPETAAILTSFAADTARAPTERPDAQTGMDPVERARERLLLYAATGESDPVRAEAVLRGERLPSPGIRTPAHSGETMHGASHAEALLGAGGETVQQAAALLGAASGSAGPQALASLAAPSLSSSSAVSDAEPMTDVEAAEEQARRLVEQVGGDGSALVVEGAAFAVSGTVEHMLQVGEAAGLLSRHGKRVKRAREALARMVAPGRPGEIRLRALQGMSQRILGGMQWFPRELPKDKLMARLALVEEAEKVYARLYSHRQAPGAGVWQGVGGRGADEEDGEAGIPTVVTLNTMVNMYCTAGQPGRAYDFLQSEYPRWGLTPDERSLRPLVAAHAKLRRMDLAEEVVGLMLELGMQPGADSWGPLAHGYARQWQLADAVGVLQEMRDRGIECPERWAALTRIRLRDLGVWHRDVPQHPLAWQYSKSVMEKRFDKTKKVRKNRRYTLGYDRKARQRVSL
jgi:pentatricopeptide repeat protein